MSKHTDVSLEVQRFKTIVVALIFASAVFPVVAADYSWALKGTETNEWFSIRADGKTAFGTEEGVMPTSEDTVHLPWSGLSHALIGEGHTVALAKLNMPAYGTSTGTLSVAKGASLTISATSNPLCLGARDGGSSAYRNTDNAVGFLTVDGGALTNLGAAIQIGCSVGANSRSSLTLNDGVVKTKGITVGPWGYGELHVNGGQLETTGNLQIGSTYSTSYLPRAGVARMTGGRMQTSASFNVMQTGRYLQTGGAVTNTAGQPIGGSYVNDSEHYGVMELRGGSFCCTGSIFPQGEKKRAASLALRISLYGTMDYFGGYGLSGSNASDGYTNQLPLVEYVIAGGKVTPITLDLLPASGYTNYSVDKLKKWLRPDGCFQLIATNRFPMFRNIRTSMRSQDSNTTYPNAALWTSENFGSVGGFIEFGCTLKTSAKVEPGVFSRPVPFGYVELPPVKANNVRKAYMDVTLVPQGDVTFSDLVVEMKDAGHDVTVTSENAVRMNLPVERLGDRATDRKFLFDFTRQDAPYDACRGIITTNALVSAISCTVEKEKGFVIFLR